MPEQGYLSICALCNKAYTQERSYNRHVAYCRRAQTRRKGRPTSCFACNAAKQKCSFDNPCCRCVTKGISCVYGQTSSRSAMANSSEQRVRMEASPTMLRDDRPDLSDTGSLPDFFNLMASPGGLSSGTYDQLLPSVSLTACAEYTIVSPRADGCNLAKRTMSPSDLILSKATSAFTKLSFDNSVVKHASSMITHILCAFPHMMLRRQTFPPFIHGYWHQPSLPEKIASCMSISQLFAARTPETRPFLWRTIDAEEQRFRDEYMLLSAREIQSAVQALMIYIIMAIVDQDADTVKRGARMTQTFQLLSIRFRDLLGENFSSTELEKPSISWDDWVFNESRRRVACLWFLMSRVVAMQAETPCTGCDALRDLALVSSKTLWESRNVEDWQVEKAFYDASGPIATLGEFGEAKMDPANPFNAQRLQTWETGADKMAIMLGLATEWK